MALSAGRRPSRRIASKRLCCALACALSSSAALPQTSPPTGDLGRTASPGAPTATGAADAAAKKAQLEGIQKQLQGSEQMQQRLQSDLAAIQAQREKLAAGLLDATRKTRALEDQAAETESRLQAAAASEQAIRQSLSHRKSLIALVLASLQRMSRHPPPAVLVEPDDMLSAIRASMLLGALLPGMRQEVASLTADLADLSNARAAVASEKARLSAALDGMAAQRKEMQADIDARQAAETQERNSLADETSKARELAKQASDIKDLIGKMASVGGVAPGRAARRPFDRLKAALSYPVAGSLTTAFGESDEYGEAQKGDSFAAVPGAVVTAPADSTVAYSGPYRTYGQLLILNAGEGYYLVMAGMDRINVEVGQSVVAGEPVALMGDGATKTAATIAVGAAQPVLYVEFRKDGTTIDPGPWWARPDIEKARG